MLTHRHVTCAEQGCFAVITLHPDDERRLRRTHETFFCPAGHRNFFPGKTEEEKHAERLERRLEALGDRLDDVVSQRERLRDALRHGAQVCPLGCGWKGARRLPYRADDHELARFFDRAHRDLADHLLEDHNATRRPVALIAERSVSHA